ncbi:MAG: GTPase HflX [Nitrososphaerota archaeon]
MNTDRAAVVTYNEPMVIEEITSLASAAGYHVQKTFFIKKLLHGRYGIGEGKAEILKQMKEDGLIDSVIIDDKINASENYNLSNFLGCKVIDREKLVLEIFARRATSPEAKLQVKMAELLYELPRARELVRRKTMGEQPGMFGYGSYEVEKQYRSIRSMINLTKKKIEKIRKRRELFRRSRARTSFPTISLAGYTSAGKTTLFNMLTRSNQPVSPSVFTTLSTTTRRASLDGVDALLSDTVGFISRLPHYMIEAFNATLEELSFADIVLLVVDISDDPERLSEKYSTAMTSLEELNVASDKVIAVLNKVDKLSEEEVQNRLKVLKPKLIEFAFTSAKTGQGLEDLKKMIRKKLFAHEKKEELLTSLPAETT